MGIWDFIKGVGKGIVEGLGNTAKGLIKTIDKSPAAQTVGLAVVTTKGLNALSKAVAGTEAVGATANAVATEGKWVYGAFKSETKWASQFSKRGWTPEQVTEAITNGKSFDAVNMINEANGDTRYVHPTTGQSVVVIMLQRSLFMSEGLDINIKHIWKKVYVQLLNEGTEGLQTCSCS